MFTYEEMVKATELAEQSIDPRVLKVFKEHKEDLFAFMPIENQTGKISTFIEDFQKSAEVNNG